MSRVYISFSAEIAPKTTETLIAVLTDQVAKGTKEVYLLLSTPGGEVMSGMNVYNVMRAMPYKIITHNVGNVDSIGVAIYLAGAERYACPHTTFMFHGVGFDLGPGMRLEEKFLRERLDSILADQRRIGSIITDHSNLDEGQVDDLFREARTKDADAAKAAGIVHDIRNAEVPAGSTIISLVFQR